MSEEVSVSPTAPRRRPDTEAKELLSFAQALNVVCEGGRVTKMEWSDETIHLALRDERVMIMNGIQ